MAIRRHQRGHQTSSEWPSSAHLLAGDGIGFVTLEALVDRLELGPKRRRERRACEAEHGADCIWIDRVELLPQGEREGGGEGGVRGGLGGR
jgi:hypothetical protein